LNQCEPSQIERLSCLIYKKALLNGDFFLLPVTLKQKLKANVFALIADNECKKIVVKQLSEVLAGTNINIILLKGMAFNELIYGSESPRGTSDVDFLISEPERLSIEKYLTLIADKVSVTKTHSFDDLFEESWRAKKAERVFFDVHWHLSHPTLFTFDLADIFLRSVVHPFYKSQNIRVLSHEDHLVFLAIHLMKDCNFYEHGLLDCHELICQFNPEIELCFDIAKTWGAQTSLFCLLSVVKSKLNTPIDDSVIRNYSPNRLKRGLCMYLINNLFPRPSIEKTRLHRFKQVMGTLILVDKVNLSLRHYYAYLFK
jgi:hypothetical protein